ncbi:MAG TPA: hypothetical protein VIK86_05575 [Candidatus Paceibacterota bacterium]
MEKQDVIDLFVSRSKKTLSEEEMNFVGSIGESVEKAFEMETVQRNKEITAITEKMGIIAEGESVSTIIRSLASKIETLEATAKRTFSNAEKESLKRLLDGKKDEIEKVLRQKGQAWSLEFKAKRAVSALMTTSTVLTGAVAINTDNVFDDTELTLIRYPANFIGDAINSRQVSKVPFSIKWKEEIVSNDGVITTVAEGDTKPLVDFKFSWKYAYRVKYAGRIEFTEETEIDFEQLTLDIIDMFEAKVLRAYNDGLLTAILAWAPVYTSTILDLTILKPTVLNVVNAGKLMIANNSYTADTLIINPGDYAETQNMQNSLGDPIFVPDNVLFPGLKLFVTNKIPVGTALLGEGGIVKEQHGTYILRSGQYGNQLIENEKTIIGEMFSVIKLPTESSKGWVKLVIATVKEALQKPSGN